MSAGVSVAVSAAVREPSAEFVEAAFECRHACRAGRAEVCGAEGRVDRGETVEAGEDLGVAGGVAGEDLELAELRAPPGGVAGGGVGREGRKLAVEREGACAGVGGAIGEAIGEKLEAIAGKNRQVLCITHLPQIACRGEGHLVVEKGVVDGRTVSRVRVLDDVAREGEVARMLGGREITATTLTHAKEMLAHAKSSRGAALAAKAAPAKGKRPGRSQPHVRT